MPENITQLVISGSAGEYNAVVFSPGKVDPKGFREKSSSPASAVFFPKTLPEGTTAQVCPQNRKQQVVS